MKAFKLFKTYYSYIEDAETKMKKGNVSHVCINDTTSYEHTGYDGVVLDFTFTIEEVTV